MQPAMQQSNRARTALSAACSAIAIRSVTECGSCGSTLGPAIACTTRGRESGGCACLAAVTSASSRQITKGQRNSGDTMRKGHVPAAVPAKPYELERLRDPETAAAYLSIAAKEDDLAAFLQALRNVTEAMGGV